jgi:CheY-like chemotaxis protein
VHILVATDADFVLDDIVAALSGPDTSFTVCRNGRDVAGVVKGRTPDLAILDLQIGSMGGMATTMALRLDESSGRAPHVPVLMLLDRQADVHLAKRSAADGWLVKPLDALTLQRKVAEILTPASAESAEGTAEGENSWAEASEATSAEEEEETVPAG